MEAGLILALIIAHTYLGPGPAAAIVLAWFFYLIPLLIVAAPVWLLGKMRAKWNVWDFAIIALPFCAWCFAATMIQNWSAALFFMTGLGVGCMASLAPIVRVVIAGRVEQKALAYSLLIVVCLLAFVIGVLPE